MDTLTVPASIIKNGTYYGNLDVKPGEYLKIQTTLPVIHFDAEQGKIVFKIDMTTGAIACVRLLSIWDQ